MRRAAGAAEERVGRLPELDADLGLALVQRLAALEDERDALPARVVHVEDGRRKGGRRRVRRHARVGEVARLRARSVWAVLALRCREAGGG